MLGVYLGFNPEQPPGFNLTPDYGVDDESLVPDLYDDNARDHDKTFLYADDTDDMLTYNDFLETADTAVNTNAGATADAAEMPTLRNTSMIQITSTMRNMYVSDAIRFRFFLARA